MGLFRLDFGAYGAFVGLLATLTGPCGPVRRTALGHAAVFLTTGGLFLAGWLGFIALHAHLTSVFRESWSVIAGMTTGLALPLPPFAMGSWSRQNAFLVSFWIFAALPGVTLALWALVRRGLGATERVFIPHAALFAGLVFLQASHRSDVPHLLQVLSVQLPLIAWLLAQGLRHARSRLPSIGLAATATAGLLVLGPLFNTTHPVPYWAKAANLAHNGPWYFASRSDLRDYFAAVLAGTPNAWRIDLVRIIRACTSEDTPILVIPYMPQLYYFANRTFATPLGAIFPGMLPTMDAQRDLVSRLKSSDTRIVVDFPEFSFDRKPERNAHVYIAYVMKAVERLYPYAFGLGPARLRFRTAGDICASVGKAE